MTSRYTTYYKTICRLGLPILVGQLGVVVVGFADTIMVGHYSTDALASASFVNNVFNMVMFCCMGFTYGILPLVGELYGQRKRCEGEPPSLPVQPPSAEPPSLPVQPPSAEPESFTEAESHLRGIGRLLRSGLALNVLYALGLTAVMTVLYFNLHRLGQPEHLLPTIRPYYLLMLAGLVPVSVFNVMAQWSYGIKNTVVPMWSVLVTNAINILGNYLLIYGHCGLPEMGLAGAGVSTLAARVLCALAILGWFGMAKGNAPYRQGFMAGSGLGRYGVIWRTSIPVSMQMTAESGSFSMAAVMAGWIGAIPLAAYQIVVIVGMLGFCLYYAIGSAIAVLVSNEAGRGDVRGMRRAGWAGYHVMLAMATVSTGTFVLLSRPLMALFTDDPQVLGLALTLVFPLVLYQLGDATQVTFANALRGTSHVMPMLWIALVSYIVVGIPATYVLAFTAELGAYGIVLSFSVSLFMAGGLFLAGFMRETRRRSQGTRKPSM